MKSLFKKIPATVIPLLIVAAMFSACTLDDISNDIDNQELTAEEIEAATQIMGEALSDDNDGVFSSLNDALTTVSSSGFGNDSQMKAHDDDRNSGRGNESNYQYEYDRETGTHTISFNREVNNPNFQKSLSAVLTYVFTDVNGEYIAFPRQNRERIENIDFTSDKNGSTESRFRNSEFSRADTFAFTGLSHASSILTIDGKHYGNGSIDGVTRDGDTFERSFVNEINFLDIQVNKDTVAEYGSLTQGVTGTLNYELTIFRSSNGQSSSKTVTGTIEMDGDGTALLRFANVNRLFKVNLRTGFVSDDEIDIESAVAAVDTLNQTVTLRNDLLVIVSDRTEIEGDDGLDSLEAVARALDAGENVIAEVEGYRNPDNRSEFIAEEIEFEFAEDDEDDGDDNDDNE